MWSTEMAEQFHKWTRVRLSLVGRPAGIGVGGFFILTRTVSLITSDVTGTGRRIFAVAALLFGFALIGWSGSIIAGRGFENLQHHLSTGSNWTERDSRRAMARIGGFGFGGMLGVSLSLIVLA